MRLLTPLCGMALLGIAAAAYAADPVTITFATNSLTGIPGGSDLTFSGTIQNTTAFPIFLIGDTLNLTPTVPGISVDDSPLFLAAPPFGNPFLGAASIPPGAGDTFTGDILTVSLDNTVPNGSYLGTLTLLGGTGPNANPNDTNFLGSQNFRVNVVPEPSSLPLAAAGCMAGAAFFLRRRLRKK